MFDILHVDSFTLYPNPTAGVALCIKYYENLGTNAGVDDKKEWIDSLSKDKGGGRWLREKRHILSFVSAQEPLICYNEWFDATHALRWFR